MNNQRITRLLKLLQILQSGGGQSVKELAQLCGVSHRTTFRDLQSLREAGVSVEFDHAENRYSMSGDGVTPPTDLTASEAISLVALAAEMGRSDRLPFLEPAGSAARKLASRLPPPIRQALRRLVPAIKIRTAQVVGLSGKADIYQQIVAAIAARHVVRLRYESLTEWETIVTRLHPYHLLFSQRSWYVIGRSSLHREVRTFNLGRIESLDVLNRTYTAPRRFSLNRYLGNAWHLIPQPGKDFNVVIRFTPFVARNVAEVNWHPTQRTRLLDDGSLEFQATVSGLNEIVWWILGYGDQAEVLRPLRLRQMVAQRAQNLVKIYNGQL